MIEVKRSGDALYQSTVCVGDLPPVTGDFSYNPSESVTISSVLRDLEGGRCRTDNLKALGEELFETLFKSDSATLDAIQSFKAAAAAQDELLGVHLRLPPELDYLPWESMSDPRDGRFLCTDSHVCILRSGMEKQEKEEAPPWTAIDAARGLSMLVVIPGGSQLDVDREWNNLKLLQRTLPITINIVDLRGGVTPQVLDDALRNAHYDIVHFSGHGEVDEYGAFRVRLNAEGTAHGEQWISGASFANFFDRRPPTLVVLNCCYGAASARKGRRDFSAIGPALLVRGVTAVVAMRYEILDVVAVHFAQTFYTQLFTGRLSGRVDYAITESRRAIDWHEGTDTARGFITPVLFLRRKCEHLWTISPMPVVPPSPPPPPPPPHFIIDPVLLECIAALRNGNCIAMIGANIASAALNRSSPPTPLTSQALATRLAAQCQFTLDPAILQGAAGEWLAGMLLPWVCQQYAKENERFMLLDALHQAYKGIQPTPEMNAISRWSLPGIVYLPFDGLLETALKQNTQSFRPVYALDSKLSGDVNGTLLFCPTGSLQADPSLILTEAEHEDLYSRASRMSSILRQHMAGDRGRCTVVLGASPRDRLVRLLISRLQIVGPRRTQGPTYFFTREYTLADQNYWAKYNVRWITADPRVLFEAMA